MNQKKVFFIKVIKICIILLWLTYLFNESCQAEKLETDGNLFLPQKRPLRLPNSTFPLRYHLHITSHIHLKDFNYTGNVTIDIEIKESTNEIVLHATDLRDFMVKVENLKTKELLADIIFSYDQSQSFLIIHSKGNYQAFEEKQVFRVEILFKGTMKEKTNGLYWLTYDYHNETIYLAATQSEPSFARLIFPCYDEPAFKSNFTIEITHGSNYSAISNMHVRSMQQHESDTGMTTTLFYSTPPMSTYLIAFIISDFECISDEFEGVKQSIYTSPGSSGKGEKALQNAIRTLATFEKNFGIKYSLTKLDHIALKKNYGAAMENWGLITYKDDTLIRPDNLDLHKNLKSLLTINHEIAHQWFGNLVTPEWWSYAWLNEGFATYFSYVITDQLYPELKIMEYFLKDVAEHAFSYSVMATRPMTFYVEKESDINSVFDIISYRKAACIIRMFHNAFTNRAFMTGINSFLQKFEYSVANEMNLFERIQEAVLADEQLKENTWVQFIPDIMMSWTHTEWIPIVKITRNDINKVLTICQDSNDKHANEVWWIPLNFATPSQNNFMDTKVEYFMPPIACVDLKYSDLGIDLTPQDFLIVNKQQTGFYHVLYDDDNLLAIAKQLQTNHSVIHSFNRAALFQDLEPLIEHNSLKAVESIFELLKYLGNEMDLLPWNFVSDTIQFMEKNLYGTPSHSLFLTFIRRLVAPIFNQLHLVNNTQTRTTTDTLAKQKILEIACLVDIEECLNYTKTLAYNYIFHHIEFEKLNDYYGMQDAILCFGMKSLNEKDFEQLMDILRETEAESTFFDDLIYSMKCIQNRTFMYNYLNVLMYSISTTLMKDNSKMLYIFYLFRSNLAARSVVWRFIERNYKRFCTIPSFVENFNRLSEYVPQQYRHQFRKVHEAVGLELANQGLDPNLYLINLNSARIGKKAASNELFVEKFENSIHEWLLKELYPRSYIATGGLKNGSTNLSSFMRRSSKLLRKILSVF